MDIQTTALLAATGAGGGIVAATIGGGSLVTYPVLLAVGLSPLSAAIVTNVSLIPSNFVAALADRSQLPPLDKSFARLVAASLGGGTAGALLLIATPDRVFELIVPLLLAFATAMFVMSEHISNWLKRRAKRRGDTRALTTTSFGMLLPVSFYGGYFGSGVGILLLAVLSIATTGNYRMANAVKNLVLSLGTLAAATIYALQGAILWPQAGALAAGTIVGGFAGSWVARVMPQKLARWLVTLCGVALTVGCAIEYWL